jgi:hypothetical protein
MASDSTNDKLLRIALREIMPIRLLLLAYRSSVTWITALGFDVARPEMVSYSEGLKKALRKVGTEDRRSPGSRNPATDRLDGFT